VHILEIVKEDLHGNLIYFKVSHRCALEGNFLGMQRKISTILFEYAKKMYVTNFLPTNFLQRMVHHIFLHHVPTDWK